MQIGDFQHLLKQRREGETVRIAVDCMGGDYAPREIVRGAIQGGKIYNAHLYLVGNPAAIQAELDLIEDKGGVHYEIVPASEVIEMGEHPATAIRKKKDASIVVACNLVGDKIAQGVVAAGSTGAAMTAAIFRIGRIEGIDRPAIAVVLPSTKPRHAILVDAGANSDCLPEMLVQFAKMGSVFSKEAFGVENPRVGLLNIGEEATKGNSLYVLTHKLLEQQGDLNFTGNVEGKHMFNDTVDVVVCDGFTGNIALKTAEGVGNMVTTFMKEELTQGLRIKAGVLLAKNAFKSIKRRVSDEDYGGALLLGIKGICVIGHGRSNAYAVSNAIRVTRDAILQDVVGKIEQTVLKTHHDLHHPAAADIPSNPSVTPSYEAS